MIYIYIHRELYKYECVSIIIFYFIQCLQQSIHKSSMAQIPTPGLATLGPGFQCLPLDLAFLPRCNEIRSVAGHKGSLWQWHVGQPGTCPFWSRSCRSLLGSESTSGLPWPLWSNGNCIAMHDLWFGQRQLFATGVCTGPSCILLHPT